MKEITDSPWRLNPNDPAMVVDCRGYSVALAASRSTPTERKANACLIAAAPELLALLQEIVDTREWHAIDNVVCKRWDERCEEVIAKAKGEAK